MPRSRQMKAISVSCEPLSAATRQALLCSSNCSGVTSPRRAKKSFSDTKAILSSNHTFPIDTRQTRKSCAEKQNYSGKPGGRRMNRHKKRKPDFRPAPMRTNFLNHFATGWLLHLWCGAADIRLTTHTEHCVFAFQRQDENTRGSKARTSP